MAQIKQGGVRSEGQMGRTSTPHPASVLASVSKDPYEPGRSPLHVLFPAEV